MLLKSIRLENFRQFCDSSIDFATCENGKNVTIIIGENGTGKTTFAQAFFWCLYGDTEFSDKILINKIVADEMLPGDVEKVKVTLELWHGELFYTLIREQEYKKIFSNTVKAQNSRFNISRKDKSGETRYVEYHELESEVQQILPRELSRYFFFDGERIERMSKDISAGTKSTDFADAVQGLLGLKAIRSAIDHFNPRSKYGVIGSYENSFDSSSNKTIQQYTDKINSVKEKIVNLTTSIDELKNQIEMAEKRKNEKQQEIKQFEDGERLQNQKDELLKEITYFKIEKSDVYKNISNDFNSNSKSFISISLIEKALNVVSEVDLSDKDIPNMHGNTIDYLLNQGKCICGTQLNDGSIAYNKVKELKDYLPPKSLSTIIGEFKRQSRSRNNNYNDLYTDIRNYMEKIDSYDDEIIKRNEKIKEINEKLSSDNVSEKVRSINKDIKHLDESIRKNSINRDSQIEERGKLQSNYDRRVSERDKFALLDEKNKKIAMYKSYAERIYERLNEVYDVKESEIRERLEENINDIFNKVYDGGLYLAINEKYQISVCATNYEGDVETSTGQSIAVIFAFITSVIKMARQNRSTENKEAELLSSEPYPLVMDAPLSTFDKRRIKNICETIPQMTDQVVIFIKDLDGEIAEKYMHEKIGSRRALKKNNEFETIIN